MPPFSIQIFDTPTDDVNGSNDGAAPRPPSLPPHLLPASYRTRRLTLAVARGSVAACLRADLDVRRLDAVHQWLWIVGRPLPPRPLHVQRMMARSIVVCEQLDLHLVWQPGRIFVKPLPRYLLSADFWAAHLCCSGAGGSAEGHDDNRVRYHNSTTAVKAEEGTAAATGAGVSNVSAAAADTAALHACALGFLLSYTVLVAYESDFLIAKELHLLPAELSWPQWVQLVDELLPEKAVSATSMTDDDDDDLGRGGGRCRPGLMSGVFDKSAALRLSWHSGGAVSLRWEYGELRLGRLELIYRLLKGKLRLGYLGHYGLSDTYHSFLRRHVRSLITLFAYATVVLSAMQVALNTTYGQKNTPFQSAAYVCALLAIMAPMAFLLAVIGALVALLLYNTALTVFAHRERFGGLLGRAAAAASADERATSATRVVSA